MLAWAVRYLVAAVVAGGLFAVLQGRDGPALEAAARRVVAEIPDHDRQHAAPQRADEGGDLEEIIRAGPHGHFLVEAVVNGVPVDFMIDTGASHIVLALQDARKLGYGPGNLDFSQEFQSANGTVRAAPVELRELRVGQLQLYDVEASVNGGPLPISLLGMSFLQQLRSYEVAHGRLILRW
jgi:aspartyl protease family protein